MDNVLLLFLWTVAIVVVLVVGVRVMLSLARDRPRTRREYALGFGTTNVDGDRVCKVAVRANACFEPRRLTVAPRSGDFLIFEVLVGDEKVFCPVGAVPASVLAPGDSFPLGGKVARPGDFVTIIVRNTASAPREFQAVVVGPVRRS